MAVLGRNPKEGKYWEAMEALRSTRKHQEALGSTWKHLEGLGSPRLLGEAYAENLAYIASELSVLEPI